MKTEMRFDMRYGVVVPEIRDVTFGLWGSELPEHAAIQRLARAGFPIWRINQETSQSESPLLEMFAIIEGESGSYLKAWHANVRRDPETKAISLDAQGRMTVQSIDLGFIQLNINVSPDLVIAPEKDSMRAFVEEKFAARPELARADISSLIAYDLWQDRGYSPWFAWKPGTAPYRLKKRRAAKAVGNWLLRTHVGKIDEQGEPADSYPRLDFI